jgi:hypothetical protein
VNLKSGVEAEASAEPRMGRAKAPAEPNPTIPIHPRRLVRKLRPTLGIPGPPAPRRAHRAKDCPVFLGKRSPPTRPLTTHSSPANPLPISSIPNPTHHFLQTPSTSTAVFRVHERVGTGTVESTVSGLGWISGSVIF